MSSESSKAQRTEEGCLQSFAAKNGEAPGRAEKDAECPTMMKETLHDTTR